MPDYAEVADFVQRHYDVPRDVAVEHVKRSAALGLDASLLETHLIQDESGQYITYPAFKSLASFIQAWTKAEGGSALFDDRAERLVTDPEELAELGAPAGSTVVRGVLIDTIAQARFYKVVDAILHTMRDHGAEAKRDEIFTRIEHEFPPPTKTPGIGIVWPDEVIDPKYRMSAYQLAQLRMQRNAINKRVPITTFMNIAHITGGRELTDADFEPRRSTPNATVFKKETSNLKSSKPFD